MISVMMVTYNRLELTKQTVENLYNTIHEPFNFIIVDNNSTDETVEYLNKLNKEKNNIHLKLNNTNRGIAIGRNQALLIANKLNTNWYVTIDNDVLLPEGWLDECINILKANRGFGSIGVSFENTIYPIIKSNEYEFEYKARGNLGTACTVFPKSTHQLIGFFSTEYGIYGLDDTNFFNRVIFAGLKIGYIKTHGIHLGEGEFDTGPYREFKTKQHDENLPKYHKDYSLYSSGKKSIYISYKEVE